MNPVSPTPTYTSITMHSKTYRAEPRRVTKSPPPKQADIPCVVKSATSADIDAVTLVIDSWCSSYKAYGAEEIEADVFKVEQRDRIFRLLGKAQLTLAVSPNGEVLGWCVHGWEKKSQVPVVHYMYVKKESRHGLIGERLLRATGWRPGSVCWVTHWMPCVRALKNKWGWIYNPYLLERSS
jgi:hypothetical protein